MRISSAYAAWLNGVLHGCACWLRPEDWDVKMWRCHDRHIASGLNRPCICALENANFRRHPRYKIAVGLSFAMSQFFQAQLPAMEMKQDEAYVYVQTFNITILVDYPIWKGLQEYCCIPGCDSMVASGAAWALGIMGFWRKTCISRIFLNVY